MANYPKDRHYTEEHEWLLVDDEDDPGAATVGITEYAQDQLGDIIFVEFPEVGETYDLGDPFGVVESVKAISDLFMPVGGEITEVNEELIEDPEVVNSDPYEEGWLVRIDLEDQAELRQLLDADEYEEYTGG